jgi:putative aminopeptidase FrvX
MRATTIQGKVLATALSTKRPHGSKTNVKFTAWLRDQLPLDLNKAAFYDGAGNLHVDNRSKATHKTLFVAHVDTVHRNEGKNKITKTKTHWRAKGDVLGADDGAGVALLMHMIHANVRGYYIFTQGEERGGVGARYLAEKMPDLLREFDRAIAFDRRGIDSSSRIRGGVGVALIRSALPWLTH